MLGPVLFIMYSNEIDFVQVYQSMQMTEHSKFFPIVKTNEDQDLLQDDLDRVVDWSEKWKMELNEGKCHVIHFGKNNPEKVYTMGSSTLKEIEEDMT